MCDSQMVTLLKSHPTWTTSPRLHRWRPLSSYLPTPWTLSPSQSHPAGAELHTSVREAEEMAGVSGNGATPSFVGKLADLIWGSLRANLNFYRTVMAVTL